MSNSTAKSGCLAVAQIPYPPPVLGVRQSIGVQANLLVPSSLVTLQPSGVPTRNPFRKPVTGRQRSCRGSLQNKLESRSEGTGGRKPAVGVCRANSKAVPKERHVSARFTCSAGASLPAEASAQAGHRFSHAARWRNAGGKRGLVLRSEATSQSSTATQWLSPLSASLG